LQTQPRPDWSDPADRTSPHRAAEYLDGQFMLLGGRQRIKRGK